MKIKNEFTVHEFAKLCGTTIRTINHYEELGLIQPLKTLDNGYRIFGMHQMEQISSIMLYKDYGFSLKQIKELIHSSDLESQMHHLKLQKEIINKQKKILIDKEERINYTLSEIRHAHKCPQMHITEISHHQLSVTYVQQDESFFINYLLNGFRNGIIIHPTENRVIGFFSTEENGQILIQGKCLCTYITGPGFEVNSVINAFKEAAFQYQVPLSDIYAETIIETNNTFLIKYYMLIPDDKEAITD